MKNKPNQPNKTNKKTTIKKPSDQESPISDEFMFGGGDGENLPFLVMFGRVLRSFRQSERMSQKELADSIEGRIDSSYIGRIERGQQNSSIQTIARILSALGVRWSQILQGVAFIERVPLLSKDSAKFRLLGTIGSLSESEVDVYLEVMRLYNRFVHLIICEKGKDNVLIQGVDYIQRGDEGNSRLRRVASATAQDRYRSTPRSQKTDEELVV